MTPTEQLQAIIAEMREAAADSRATPEQTAWFMVRAGTLEQLLPALQVVPQFEGWEFAMRSGMKEEFVRMDDLFVLPSSGFPANTFEQMPWDRQVGYCLAKGPLYRRIPVPEGAKA